jgi:hypothetical protein
MFYLINITVSLHCVLLNKLSKTQYKETMLCLLSKTQCKETMLCLLSKTQCKETVIFIK